MVGVAFICCTFVAKIKCQVNTNPECDMEILCYKLPILNVTWNLYVIKLQILNMTWDLTCYKLPV